MKKVLLTLGVVCFSLIPALAEIDFESAVGGSLMKAKGVSLQDISGEGNDGEVVKAPWVDGKFSTSMAKQCVTTEQKLLDALEVHYSCMDTKHGRSPCPAGLVGQNDSPEFGFIDAE